MRTFAEAREAARGTIALVPTMGYLHEGHLALVEAVRRDAGTVLMSLFVNPLQFDDDDDFARYPRDGARDAALASAAGVDILFAPGAEEMYPEEPQIIVTAGPLGGVLEGEHRPGHFDGVTTVVAKLFAGLQPDLAAFGRKDAQQLSIVGRLVADLSFPVRIVGVSTVREPDGLALSSRNLFIEDREAALSLSRGLLRAADALEAGERRAGALEGIVAEEVGAAAESVDYVRLVHARSLEPVAQAEGEAFLAVAARVTGVRLIDNLYIGSDGSVDRGTRLTSPSALTGGG